MIEIKKNTEPIELRTLREISELEKVDDISLNEQIEKIEKQIISYRRKKFKSDQNIYLKTKVNFFPDWVFSENNNNAEAEPINAPTTAVIRIHLIMYPKISSSNLAT